MAVSGQNQAPGHSLAPGKGPPGTIVQQAGWAPEPVWIQRLEEKSFRGEDTLHFSETPRICVFPQKYFELNWTLICFLHNETAFHIHYKN
jgi:hypothetical protein